jgi:hypothetical protein
MNLRFNCEWIPDSNDQVFCEEPVQGVMITLFSCCSNNIVIFFSNGDPFMISQLSNTPSKLYLIGNRCNTNSTVSQAKMRNSEPNTVSYRVCTTVFYYEGWLLLATGTFMLLFPSLTIKMFGISAESSLAGYFLQQFCVMCILMGYVGVRSHPTLSNVTVQACLIADFLYIAMFVPLVQEFGQWTAGSIFSVAVTAFLALTRIAHLILNKSVVEAPKDSTSLNKNK